MSKSCPFLYSYTLYINGQKLEERVSNPLYTVASISGDTNNTYINFANVQALPGGNLAADAKIVVDEKATIDYLTCSFV